MECATSMIPCLFGCVTLCGLRDRVTRELMFFPPTPASYEFDLKSSPPIITRFVKTSRGKKKSEYQSKFVKLGFIETQKKMRVPYMHIDYPNADTTIIFSHGNATDVGHMRDHFLLLAERLKVSLLAYDYSGYGLSTGKPTPAYVYCDIEAVYDHYLKECQTKHVIFYGQSLGSGPTCYIARKHKADGVIVHSGFMSALSVVEQKVRSNFLWFDLFKNVENLKHNQAPLFVIHGQKDVEIPIHHGMALHDASPQTYPPWYVEDAGHNNIEARHKREYIQQLKNFVKFVRDNADATSKSKEEEDKLIDGPGTPRSLSKSADPQAPINPGRSSSS